MTFHPTVSTFPTVRTYHKCRCGPLEILSAFTASSAALASTAPWSFLYHFLSTPFSLSSGTGPKSGVNTCPPPPSRGMETCVGLPSFTVALEILLLPSGFISVINRNHHLILFPRSHSLLPPVSFRLPALELSIAPETSFFIHSSLSF